MAHSSTSSFQFKNYIISKAQFEIDNANIGTDLQFEIEPSVEKTDESRFVITLDIQVSDSEKHMKFTFTISGFFECTANDANVINYMSVNGPAIIFPYIRAYVTNMTALSGIKPIIIPTLNLSGLGPKIKEQITALL